MAGKRRKIVPGKLSLPKPDEPLKPRLAEDFPFPPELAAVLKPIPPPADVWPPFMSEDDVRMEIQEQQRKREEELTRPRVQTDHSLKARVAARSKAEKLAGEVRDRVFIEWIRRCVLPAKRPDEWTQATDLYEHYLKFAPTIARNRGQRGEIVLTLATVTMWGKMMRTMFPKRRTGRAIFYPLKAKGR